MLGLFAVAAPGAHAQDVSEDAGQYELGPIIVTAQKRSEQLQDVPIAIAAITSDGLEAAGIEDTQDLSLIVPSLVITSDTSYMLPRIRGIGNNVIGAGFESGVATYIDGVYIAALPSSLTSVANVERIEVLKGPQGTLFGRNSTGGLIHIVTSEPKQDPSGRISVGYGNYDTFTAKGYVTGGLGAAAAADFSAYYAAQGNGYGTNLANGKDVNRADEELALRGSLLIEPGAATTIRIIGDYSRSHGSQCTSFILAPGTTTFLPQGQLDGTRDVNADEQPVNRYHGGGVSGRIEHDFGGATLTNIASYRESFNRVTFDGDATFIPFFNLSVTQRDKQFSEELQLASNGSDIQWIVGGYYFHNSSKYDPAKATIYGAMPPPFVANTYSDLKTDALAAYAQVTVPLGEQIDLTGGIRYNTEKRSIDAFATFEAGGPESAPAPFPAQSKRYSKPTWRISLDHKFTPDMMVYASYNRGFKSGGYNGQLPADEPFRPEQLDAFELGFKAELMDRKVQLTGATFYYDYKDVQVGRFTGQQISYYNGAAARVYGAEMDFLALLAPGLSLSGGFTWLDSKFSDFPNAIIAEQTDFGVVTSVGSATGNKLPQSPDFVSTLGFTYEGTTGDRDYGFSVNWNYNDGYYSQPDNFLRQPSFHMINVSANIEVVRNIKLIGWVRNLTNEDIYNTLVADSFHAIASYQPPRTYGVTIEAAF
jgi:outer membrane receptor protein involved in Fe transport